MRKKRNSTNSEGAIEGKSFYKTILKTPKINKSLKHYLKKLKTISQTLTKT